MGSARLNDLVIDTHVALWWSLGLDGLSQAAERALASAETIGVPAICFWETAVLVRKKKVALEMSVQEWTGLLLRIPRVMHLPLTATVAVQANGLRMHADPADRFIVATALDQEAPLLTKDRSIRKLTFVKTVW